MNKDKIEICVRISHETEAALLVSDTDDTEKSWLPKSQIDYDEDAGIGDTVVVTVPEWLAYEKGLI